MLDELHQARARHSDCRFVMAQATLTVLDGLGESLPTNVEDRLGEIRSGAEYRQWSAISLQRPHSTPGDRRAMLLPSTVDPRHARASASSCATPGLDAYVHCTQVESLLDHSLLKRPPDRI
jgi:hypothetical protein